ncbi:ATPase [Paraconexibacter algicola]|uniref:ATPase n=1 Tax=Paraconexibacter algicola TaxID=2133960 RepID=A0A2T4UKW9_9ACTN|nr:ATPase [Paraconexibacter algicola]
MSVHPAGGPGGRGQARGGRAPGAGNAARASAPGAVGRVRRVTVVIDLPAAITRRATSGPQDGLVVGVDAGGTKTLAAALDLATGAVTTGRSGPANPDAIGLDDAVAAITEAVGEATGDREDVRAVLVAGAGTDAATLGEAVVRALPSAVFVNDVVAAWAAVAAGEPAIAVISGTGSNALGVDGEHRARRAGGWGHVFGDEGSGHWLGREAVGAAIRAYDGRDAPTLLGTLLCEETGAASAADAVIGLYADGAGKTRVAALAPIVSRAAAQGDAAATALLARGGEALADHVVAIADALELGADAVLPIGLTGSTWKAGGALTARFAEVVAQRLPGAEIRRVQTPPVVGSLALALHACERSDAIEALLPDAAAALADA